MMMPHAIRLLEREIRRAEEEYPRVILKSEEEAMKVRNRIDVMTVELVKLNTLVDMFKTKRDEDVSDEIQWTQIDRKSNPIITQNMNVHNGHLEDLKEAFERAFPEQNLVEEGQLKKFLAANNLVPVRKDKLTTKQILTRKVSLNDHTSHAGRILTKERRKRGLNDNA